MSMLSRFRSTMSNISSDGKGERVRLRITIGSLELKGRQPGVRFAVQWSKGKHKETTEVAPLNQQGVCVFNEAVMLTTTVREEKPKIMKFRILEAVRSTADSEKLIRVLDHELDLSQVYFDQLQDASSAVKVFEAGASALHLLVSLPSSDGSPDEGAAAHSLRTPSGALLRVPSSVSSGSSDDQTQPNGSPAEQQREWKRRISDLYRKYREVAEPLSQETIDALVVSYVGEEGDLYERLSMKYEDAVRAKRESQKQRKRRLSAGKLPGVREEDSTEDTMSPVELSPTHSSLSGVSSVHSIRSPTGRPRSPLVGSVDHGAILAEAAAATHPHSDSQSDKDLSSTKTRDRSSTVVKTPTLAMPQQPWGTFTSVSHSVVITEEAEGLSLSFGNIIPSDEEKEKERLSQTAGVGGSQPLAHPKREHRHTLPLGTGKGMPADAGHTQVSSRTPPQRLAPPPSPPITAGSPRLLHPATSPKKSDSPRKSLVSSLDPTILGQPLHALPPPRGLVEDPAVVEHTTRIISGKPRDFGSRILSGRAEHMEVAEVEVRSTPGSTPHTYDLRTSPGRSELLGEGSSDDEVEGGPLDPRDHSDATGFYIRKPNLFVVRTKGGAAGQGEAKESGEGATLGLTITPPEPGLRQAGPSRMAWKDFKAASLLSEGEAVAPQRPMTPTAARPKWSEFRCDLGGPVEVGMSAGPSTTPAKARPATPSWAEFRDTHQQGTASLLRPSVGGVMRAPLTPPAVPVSHPRAALPANFEPLL